ncbi:MAG: protein kinase [Polyangiaceae bacterium]
MADSDARQDTDEDSLLEWLLRPRAPKPAAARAHSDDPSAPPPSDPQRTRALPAQAWVLLGTEPPHLPKLPDRYVDRGQLGMGGMGEVRNVRDVPLRREVAMKLLGMESLRRPSMIQTFIEEARTVGQLEHPHIPPIYELGADEEGIPYFTMKRIRGVTLFRRLRQKDLPPGSSERLREGIEILVKVCDALSFAHSRGVLHRDLKSDNIMVGDFGEVYLMDWGLAKVLRDRCKVDVPRPANSPLANLVESLVGTVAYMSPEQAAADPVDLDERTDIFGLGAVLYEIVTGKYPYRGDDDDEVLERVRACDFVPPHKVDPDVFVPRQIASVVMKAMAKNPADRYASVADMKRDLQRFLHRGLYLPRITYSPGDVIVSEGAIGHEAYIITRGECDVFKQVNGERRLLRRMGPRSVFGETAILKATPRTATVVAATEVTVLTLSREVLTEGLSDDRWESLLVTSLIDRFRDLEGKLMNELPASDASIAKEASKDMNESGGREAKGDGHDA